jgi:hypothetical protein
MINIIIDDTGMSGSVALVRRSISPKVR